MIRSATIDDAAAIAHVHVESWRTTYRGLVPDVVINNLSVEGRVAGWRNAIERKGNQKSFVLVASEENDVIGFVNGGLERTGDRHYTAELYAIYLLKTHQGRGYGKALFRATVATFIEHGHNAMMLWTLSTNPARRFYEGMSGRYLSKTKPIDIGDMTLEEVAYGWDDLPTSAR